MNIKHVIVKEERGLAFKSKFEDMRSNLMRRANLPKYKTLKNIRRGGRETAILDRFLASAESKRILQTNEESSQRN